MSAPETGRFAQVFAGLRQARIQDFFCRVGRAEGRRISVGPNILYQIIYELGYRKKTISQNPVFLPATPPPLSLIPRLDSGSAIICTNIRTRQSGIISDSQTRRTGQKGLLRKELLKNKLPFIQIWMKKWHFYRKMKNKC